MFTFARSGSGIARVKSAFGTDLPVDFLGLNLELHSFRELVISSIRTTPSRVVNTPGPRVALRTKAENADIYHDSIIPYTTESFRISRICFDHGLRSTQKILAVLISSRRAAGTGFRKRPATVSGIFFKKETR